MKRIKSESNFTDEDFKIKIGTMNKKNPDVVYIELGSYISPKKEEKSYKGLISNIEKNSKETAINILQNSGICKNDFIFISEIADERISIDKKSYLEIQIYIKPTESIKNENKFSELSKKINENCVSKIIPCVKEYISENGFEYYKSRK
jgi:hypothetical protein